MQFDFSLISNFSQHNKQNLPANNDDELGDESSSLTGAKSQRSINLVEATAAASATTTT